MEEDRIGGFFLFLNCVCGLYLIIVSLVKIEGFENKVGLLIGCLCLSVVFHGIYGILDSIKCNLKGK